MSGNIMDHKMMVFALWMLLIVPLWNITNGDDGVSCSREGRVCMDCNTLGYCHGNLTYDDSKKITCPPSTVCDEWSLQCVRNGICRYKPVTCPMTAGIIPDPYSCRGYIDCSDGFAYICPPKTYFTNGTCKDATNEKSCEEYPILCMEEGSRTVLDACFTFECTKENSTLYPKFIGDECSSSSSSSTDKTTEITTVSTSTSSTESSSLSTAGTSDSDTTTSVSKTTTMTSDSGTTVTKEPTTNNSPSTTTEMSSSTETSVTTDHESSPSESTSSTTEMSSTATSSDIPTKTDETPSSISTTQTNPTSSATDSTTSLIPTTSSATTTSPQPFECTSAGFFEDPSDCTKYYRCTLVDGKLVKDHLSCRPGLHFDPGAAKCVPGDCNFTTSSPLPTTKTTPTTTESTTTSPPTTTPQITTSPGPFECTTVGLFEDPNDCSKYYRCSLVDGKYVKEHLSCRPGSHFDPGAERCVPGDCNATSISPSPTTKTTPTTTESTTTSPPTTTPQITTSPHPFECTNVGLFEDPNDCSKYYRCSLLNDKFIKEHLSCRPGSHFDPGTAKCVPGDCQQPTSNTASSSTTPVTKSTIISSTEASSTTVVSTTSALTTTTTKTTTSPTSTTAAPFSCDQEGLFKDPLDCHKYYKCYLSGDSFVMQHISCRPGTYFDPTASRCVLGECKMTTQMVSTTTAPTVPPPFTCKSEGFFQDPEDCTKYYKCYLSGDTFVLQHISCRPGSHFDPVSKHCVLGDCTNSYKEEKKSRRGGKTDRE